MIVPSADATRHRHFIRLAYLGARFHGWQIQPHDVSVQQCVEDALSTIFRTRVAIVGAGRTDAGVNASMMIAHTDLPEVINSDTTLVRSLNSILGPDIVVNWVHPANPDAHARFDAVARTYHYYAHRSRTPFACGLSWPAPPTLDFDLMNKAAAMLLNVSDFTSFSKLHTDVKTNICRVTEAHWQRISNMYDPTVEQWVFVITADRFLRNMVRAVVGTLVDVGRGKISLDDFAAIIEAKNRCAAGTSMPPSPLFLHNIEYPYPI